MQAHVHIRDVTRQCRMQAADQLHVIFRARQFAGADGATPSVLAVQQLRAALRTPQDVRRVLREPERRDEEM